MKRFITAIAAFSLLAGSVVSASAQNRRDDHRDNGPAMHGSNNAMMMGPNRDNRGHSNWRKGGRIDRNDWNRGRRVDYHSRHLQAPPRGYEWRQVDNNYVLAAVATGLIASILLANH